MEALYDRIIHNEIKMKDPALEHLGGGGQAAAAAAASASWLDTIMNLIPGRAKLASNEPNDDAIRRTHEYLRCVRGSPAPLYCHLRRCLCLIERRKRAHLYALCPPPTDASWRVHDCVFALALVALLQREGQGSDVL